MFCEKVSQLTALKTGRRCCSPREQAARCYICRILTAISRFIKLRSFAFGNRRCVNAHTRARQKIRQACGGGLCAEKIGRTIWRDNRTLRFGLFASTTYPFFCYAIAAVYSCSTPRSPDKDDQQCDEQRPYCASLHVQKLHTVSLLAVRSRGACQLPCLPRVLHTAHAALATVRFALHLCMHFTPGSFAVARCSMR